MLPKLTDFGLAKRLDGSGQTQTGSVLGTPSYMAPEQAEGKKDVGPPADVYALGAILYECLTGRPPFKAATPLDTILQVLDREPVPPRQLNPVVPRDLETIALTCLRKQPGGRYPSAATLADDLRRFLDGHPITARRTGAAERAWKWARRRPAGATLAAVLAAVFLGVVVGFPLLLRRERHQRQHAEALERDATEARRASERDLALRGVTVAYHDWQAGNLIRLRPLLDACPEGLRGWEWHYVDRLSRPGLTDLKHGRSRVAGLAYSPDGRVLAAAGWDGVIRVWRADSLAHERDLTAYTRPPPAADFERCQVAWHPSGRFLAAGGDGNRVKVWEVATGKEVASLERHTGRVLAVAFSPDGTRLASAGLDGRVYLWDAAGAYGRLSPHFWCGPVRHLAFRPDGRQLAIAAGQVILWRFEKEFIRPPGHTHGVFGVAYSPDGRLVASAGGPEAVVRVHNADTGQRVVSLPGHANFVLGVAFSPDGRQLASCGWYGMLKLWDTATWRERQTLTAWSTVLDVAWHPDGMEVAGGDSSGGVRLWDATNPVDADVMPDPGGRRFLALDLAGDGRLLLARSQGALLLWDPPKGRPTGYSWPGGEVHACAARPDGDRFASAGDGGVIHVWHGRQGKHLQRLQDGKAALRAAAWSPDGQVLAVGGDDGRLRLIRDADGDWKLDGVSAHDGAVRALAWFAPGSPLAGRLVSGGADGVVRLSDAAGAERDRIAGLGGVRAVAAHPAEPKLAVLTDRLEVQVWDLRDPSEAAVKFDTGHGYEAGVLAWSPDGRRLVSGGGDGMVKVFDPTTGRELLALRGHSNAVVGLRFATDGRRLYSAGQDGVLRVWDARALGPGQRRGERRDQAQAWHEREGSAAAAGQQYHALAFHLQRLTRIEPKVVGWRFQLATTLAILERFPEAAKELAGALELDANDWRAHLLQPIIAMGQGKREEYRQSCARLLDRARLPGVLPPQGRIYVAGICSTVPGAVKEPGAVVDLVEGALKQMKAPGYLDRTFYGAALFRAGRYDDAREQLLRAVKEHPQGGLPWDWFVLALVEQKRGDMSAARRWYERGRSWMETTPADAPFEVPDLRDTGAPIELFRISFHIVHREAELALARRGGGK